MSFAFVFATWIVQYLYLLNTKFQASSHLQWLYSLVCVGPGQNPSYVAAQMCQKLSAGDCSFSHRTITAHDHFGRNQLSIAFENPLNLSYQLFKSLGVNFAVLISFNQVVNVVFFSADMSSTMQAPGERLLY